MYTCLPKLTCTFYHGKYSIRHPIYNMHLQVKRSNGEYVYTKYLLYICTTIHKHIMYIRLVNSSHFQEHELKRPYLI